MEPKKKKIDPIDIIRAQNRRAIEQRQATQVSGWTLEAVESAIQSSARGDLSRIAQLSRRMMNPSMSAALGKRTGALIRSELMVQPGAEDEVSRSVAMYLEQEWFDIVPEVELAKLVNDLHMNPVTLGFVEWQSDGAFYKPRLKHLNAEFLKWDTASRRWKYHTRDEGIVDVDPGDGNWILIGRWSDGEIVGAAAVLAKHWWLQESTLLQWNDGNQRHVQPIVGIEEPLDVTATVTEKDVSTLINELKDNLVDGVFYLEGGKQLKSVDLGGSYNGTAFKDLIDHIDRKISIYFLGGNLSTQVEEGGSYAASKTHHGVEREIAKADAELVSTELRRQLIEPWCAMNFGVEVAAPHVQWNTEPAEDLSVTMDALEKLKRLAGDEWEIEDPQEIAERLGVRLKKKDTTLIGGDDV